MLVVFWFHICKKCQNLETSAKMYSFHIYDISRGCSPLTPFFLGGGGGGGVGSGDFGRLLITFANSLNPDQDRHNVGPDLDPNRLTL